MNERLERLKAALSDRYTIESELGAGGMATVYLAHDLKHDRKVAVKVLRPELAAVIGAERFLNEIKVTANLQHPHILPLHDSGEADTFLFYVMPFVDGESLGDRIERDKQLGVDEAVRITIAVANALDYAHRHEVIHRDIKPDNILLHDGQPVVADFGIALAVSAAGGERMTETGLSLGTPHYMSPEQATADRDLTGRSDVYSLACVCYEMLAGEPPHLGNTAQAVIAKIITDQPRPVTDHRNQVPEHIAYALETALQKLPADRFETAAEFAAALSESGPTISRTRATRAAVPAKGTNKTIVGVAIGFGLAMAALATWALSKPAEKPVTRIITGLAEGQGIRYRQTHLLAMAPDGHSFVYVGPDGDDTQLWVRTMNDLEARPIPGTSGAMAPFFSPDGRTVGFVDAEPGNLKTVSIDGGPVRTLVPNSVAPYGSDWADDDMIYYTSPVGGIARIPSQGGTPELVTLLDSASGVSEHDWVQALPGGNTVIYQAWRGGVTTSEIAATNIESGETKRIVDGVYAEYLDGFLFWVTADGTLSGARFDEDLLELTGPEVPLLEGIRVDTYSSAAQISFAPNGSLIYMPGRFGMEELGWVDSLGAWTDIDPDWKGDFEPPALSPDASRLAVANGPHVYIKNLQGGPPRRFTFEGSSNHRPSWSPDGTWIYFVSDRTGTSQVWRKRADGGSAEMVLDDPRTIDEVMNHGDMLILRSGSGGTNSRDLNVLQPGDSLPTLLFDSEFDDYSPAISPNGQWLAYSTNEIGVVQVLVRPFSNPSSAFWQVSGEGGREARFSHDGSRLFFRNLRGDMLVSDIAPGNLFSASTPELIFRGAGYGQSNFHPEWDIGPDGRFLMIRPDPRARNDLVIVLNWLEEAKELIGR